MLALTLYIAFGFVALLAPAVMITEQHLLQGQPFLGLSLSSLLGLQALWSVGYAIWVAELFQQETRGRLSPRVGGLLLLAVLPLSLLAAWMRPILSVDPCYYVAYGRQVVEYGLNPYAVNLWASAQDPVISQVGTMWFDNIAFYGPLALGLYSLANLLTPTVSLYALTTTLKLLFVPFYGALIGLVWLRWRTGARTWTMVAAVAANPVLLWYGLVDGHVDLVIVTFLALLGWSLQHDRPLLAALSLAAAASLKLVPIVVLPVVLGWWLHRSARHLAIFTAAFGGLYGGVYWAIGGGEYAGVVAFTHLWDNVYVASLVPRVLSLAGMENLEAIRQLSNGLFYLSVALLGLQTARGRFPDPFLPMGLALAALFFTRTYFQPWYTLWYWPLLWFASRRQEHALLSLALWTVTVLLVQLVPWHLKTFPIALATGLAVALFRRERHSPQATA